MVLDLGKSVYEELAMQFLATAYVLFINFRFAGKLFFTCICQNFSKLRLLFILILSKIQHNTTKRTLECLEFLLDLIFLNLQIPFM